MSTKKKAAKPKGFNMASGKSIESAWLHLKHHSLDHLLYVGDGVSADGEVGYAKNPKPVRVRVQDNNSLQMNQERRRLLRAATQTAGGKEIDPDTDEEILRGILKFSIVEFDNMFDGSRAFDASSDEDKDAFIDMGNFADQVLDFMTKRSNFFVRGSKGSRP